MFFFFSQFAPMFIYPLGLTIFGGLVVLWLLRNRRAQRTVLALLLGMLWLASTPLVSRQAVASLERQYPYVPPQKATKADAILLLGGFLSPGVEKGAPPQAHAAIDRLLHARHLYKAGAAPYILASGGGEPSEASLMKSMLHDLGVPLSAIQVEEKSRNTHQNALFSAQKLSEAGLGSHVLLVTSALHMRRSVATMQAQGLHVSPQPTDFAGLGSPGLDLLSFMPEAGCLHATTLVIKEYIGYVVYAALGRL